MRAVTLSCMSESMLLAAALGVVGGALAVGLVVFLRRIVLSSKELGTDAEQATYQTLHLASRAAKHLRGGIDELDAARAGKHLRALLGCDSLAIVDRSGTIAIDGDEAVRPVAERLAAAAIAGGRQQVQRRIPIGAWETDAVVAPIVGSTGPLGAIVAFASPCAPASCERRARWPIGSRPRSSSASSTRRARRSPRPRCARSVHRSARTSSTTR